MIAYTEETQEENKSRNMNLKTWKIENLQLNIGETLWEAPS